MSREMQVEYLARLILQYENSPYIDDRDLVRCQESLPLVVCADASTICVAWGRRIVVLPTHAHTHPLFFAAAVTPSTAEMITSMRCLRVPGSDDMLLVVGTSAGFVQVHHPTSSGDARCDQRKLERIHRQRVHRRPLSHMSLSCDSSTICMSAIDGIVLIDVIEVLSARQWWLKTGRETIELEALGTCLGARLARLHARSPPVARTLVSAVYETYTTGPRQGIVVLTADETLYDMIMSVNKRGRSTFDANGAGGNKAVVAAMSVGRGPPVAWFKLDRSAPSKGIISSLVAMSSKMLFGRAADEDAGAASTHSNSARASRANSGTHVLNVVERPDETIDDRGDTKLSNKEKRKLRGELVSPVASVWDEEKRECFGLVCWRGEWAACCDTLGRVIVIDIRQRSVVKMIKGYRDCHLAWSVRNGEVALMIYAPKRRSLELWDIGGVHTPRTRVEVTGSGILIPEDDGGAWLLDLSSCRFEWFE